MVAMAFAYLASDDVDAVQDRPGYYKIGLEYYYIISDADTRTYSNASLPDNDGRYYIDSPCIRDEAFSGCTKMADVRLSKNVESIGDRAFADCGGLSYILIHNTGTIGDEAFAGSGLYNIDVSPNLSGIGAGAFRDTPNLLYIPLNNTGVVEIGPGTFENSGMEFVDLRRITSLDPTAFVGSSVDLQMVTTSQDVLIPGVPRLYHDGPDGLISEIWKRDGRVTVEMSEYQYLTVTEYGGAEDIVTYSDPIGQWSFYGLFDVEPGIDYSLELRDASVTFEEAIGIDDVSIPVDGFPYTLPTAVAGDLEFLGWEIDGIGSGLFEISSGEMYDLLGRAHAVPMFGTADLVMDHGRLEGLADTGTLPVMEAFTFGDTYPHLEDVHGYSHTGWMVDGEVLSPGDPISEYRGHTAESLWKPTVLHALTYTLPDGSVAVLGQYGTNQTVYLDSLPTPEEADDERFIGWSVDGTTGSNELVMTHDVQLTPIFESRLPHTVVLDPVYGETMSWTVYDGRTFTVPSETPVSDTHDFLHWTETPDQRYSPGEEFTVTGDVTLTAEWRELSTFTVTLMCDGSEFLATHVTEGDAFVIPSAEPSSETRAFEGWSDGLGTVLRAGDEIRPTSDIALTAVWRELETYTVTYISNGETVWTDTCVEGSEYTVGFDIPVPEGWSMAAWSDGVSEHAIGSVIGISGPTTLTAVWVQRTEVTVTFDDGLGNRTQFKGYAGDGFTVDIDDPGRPDGVFVAWVMDGTMIQRGQSFTLASDVTLTAEWRMHEQFRVTFTDGDVIRIETAFDGDTITLDALQPASDSFRFVCWTDGVSNYGAGDTITVHSDIELTAVWEERRTVTVTFSTGGTVIGKQSGYEGTVMRIEQEAPVSDGREFVCWEDGSGNRYSAGDTLVLASDVTLTAVWRDTVEDVPAEQPGSEPPSEDTVTVTYLSLGTPVLTCEVAAGEAMVIDCEPVRAWFTLAGWSVDGGSSVSYHNGQTITPDGDLELHAVWKSSFPTIPFEPDDGDADPDDVPGNEGQDDGAVGPDDGMSDLPDGLTPETPDDDADYGGTEDVTEHPGQDGDGGPGDGEEYGPDDAPDTPQYGDEPPPEEVDVSGSWTSDDGDPAIGLPTAMIATAVAAVVIVLLAIAMRRS